MGFLNQTMKKHEGKFTGYTNLSDLVGNASYPINIFLTAKNAD